MTNKKTTRRALFSSFMALLLCCSMLVGTTFAWFTDTVTSTGNIIKSGTLDVEMKWADDLSNKNVEEWTDASTGAIFDYKFWEPGYTEVKYVNIANVGDLAFKYQLHMIPDNAAADGTKLAEVIDVYCAIVEDGSTTDFGFVAPSHSGFGSLVKLGTLKELMANPNGVDDGVLLPGLDSNGKSVGSDNVAEYTGEKYTGHVTACLALHMQEEAGNEYQDLNIGDGFKVQLIAAQMTYEKDSFDELYDESAAYPELENADTWDGTVDTAWYFANPEAETFTLSSAEQFAGLAALVNGDVAVPAGVDYGGMPVTFAGKTVKLDADVDLYCEDTSDSADGDPVTFRPIGDYSMGGVFKGTFDGDGHTIENFYQNGWDLGYEWGSYGSYGLFGNVNDATIRNLTISGSESYIEGGDTAFVTGSATGTCVFENITIKDSVSATYNNGNGGIIGWSGAGDYTFKNITIAEDCVLAGLWGSFDSSIGGIVGQGEPGATYNFENVDIACRLDVFNDCTASYDYYNYRMSGMIIGRLEETTTIDGTNYPDTSKYNITCKNVTVTYGEWANYHYCDPTPGLNSGRGMRYESGYSYDGLDVNETYDHSQCTTHCKELIAFDQIFGGAQYGVKGLPAYDGVTVIYNNK